MGSNHRPRLCLAKLNIKMVGTDGIEPSTSSLSETRSTTEPCAQHFDTRDFSTTKLIAKILAYFNIQGKHDQPLTKEKPRLREVLLSILCSNRTRSRN